MNACAEHQAWQRSATSADVWKCERPYHHESRVRPYDYKESYNHGLAESMQ